MPIVNAGFVDQHEKPDAQKLKAQGPTLKVKVKHYSVDASTPARDEEIVADALVDTGAQLSCIDNILAADLKLTIIDRRLISGANGSAEHPVYMCELNIPSLGLTHCGDFCGVDLKEGGQQCGVLLGRDFLSQNIMIYNGITGIVAISTE